MRHNLEVAVLVWFSEDHTAFYPVGIKLCYLPRLILAGHRIPNVHGDGLKKKIETVFEIQCLKFGRNL